MNIRKVKTAVKIADVRVNETHRANKIKIDYLPEIVGLDGKVMDPDVLTDSNGRVYLFVVDGEIKKIGGSMSKGGIKATMNFYENALQGRPGPSRFITHHLIHRELKKGKKVEVYLINSEVIKAPVKGLFSKDAAATEVAVFKEMEDKCKKDFLDAEGSYPEWNYQERNAPYPQDLKEKHNEYMRRRNAA